MNSPLGLEITKIYSNLSEYWDKEAKEIHRKGDHPIDFNGLYAVENHHNHLKLCDASGPAIILAGSGMCIGGRIVDHLAKVIEDSTNDILFVGYQAAGTPGRAIQDYADKPGGYVYLDDDRKTINAKVHTLTGYSAHADQKGLVDWIASIPEKPGAIKLVHVEGSARSTLKDVLEKRGHTVQ
ncbi:MBL fold metallo-hydrolase RNA specificity domain-containing protein [Desulfosarcina ovata]|uniref:MBL fold metallo-hydrolase RNA specificity domain-containing protein n=1 Tax=Desulfosarcina ovata TaxID=83564 RepID=UPI0012D331BE|nr:MBL fold metallo-hydrolase RNA specificity domain-containing protein [Desulfosarcina ovata]